MLVAPSLDQRGVGGRFAVLSVGHNTGSGVDVSAINSLVAKCLGHQAAGEALPKTDHHVIGPGSQFADRGKPAQNLVDGVEFLLDPVLQLSLAVGGEQLFRSVAMAVAETRADGQSAIAVPTARGFGCGQKLVGDFGHGADHDHGPLAPGQPALDNFGGAFDGRSIFDRSAAKLHHHRLHTETAT